MRSDEIIDTRLHHVAVTPKTTWSFVSLHLADGTVGWGEATLVRAPGLLDAKLDAARQALNGHELVNITKWLGETVTADMATAAIRSAVEQASLDALGKRASCSASTFFDGNSRHNGIQVYANINRRTVDRTPEGFFDSAVHALTAGYTALKIAPFDDVTPANASTVEGRALIEAGLGRIAAVRQAAGSLAEIYVDCHWRFDTQAAAGILNEVAALGVTWFECPLPEVEETMRPLRQLRAQANNLGIRLAGLEELTHPNAFLPWLQAGCYDVVMPDVKYAGGISGTVSVGELAQRHDTTCAPHNPTGPLCHAASLIACGVGVGMAQLEHQYDETPLFHELVGHQLPYIVQSMSAMPTGPGLGVSLDCALMERLAMTSMPK